MLFENDDTLKSGVFITFSGNCKEALMLYQVCFGGELHFDTFDEGLGDYAKKPVIRGSLVSGSIVIHGSDLVHDEGRKIGNYLSVFLLCQNTVYRNALIARLKPALAGLYGREDEVQQLIEITDAFDVRWVLGV